MRNCVWLMLLALASVKAKPLVSVGLGVQAHRPYTYPAGQTYNSNNYYGVAGPVHSADYYAGDYRYPYPAPYPAAYPSPYSPGQRFGAALDIGIGALSLTPFLL